LVWLGFVFLLDPLNHRLGAPSLLGDWQRGSHRRLFSLLCAGFVCGFLWECWNYWAGAKWIYTVPFVGHLKIFEMPLLGFFGFPPFAVECFVITHFVARLHMLLRERLPSCLLLPAWACLAVLLFLLDLLVFYGIDRYTVWSTR